MATDTMSEQILGLLRDINAKQDRLFDRVARLEAAVDVDVAVSAQQRDAIDARFASIERTLSEDVKPQTDDLKRMKTLGISIIAMAGMAGASLTGMLVWAGDTAVAWVRAWLRIGS